MNILSPDNIQQPQQEVKPVTPRPVESPEKGWDLDRLAEFALASARTASGLEAQIVSLKSQVTRLHYVRGEALSLAQELTKGKRGRWTQWRREKGLDKRADDYDLKLWKRAQDRGGWDAIAHLGLTEARIELGVTPVTEAASVPMTEGTPLPVTEAASVPHDRVKNDQAITPRSSTAAVLATAAHEEVDLPSGESASSPSVEHGLAVPAAEETIFNIVRRLVQLERDVHGEISESCIPLIDQAVEVLGRLRCVSTRKDLAA